MKKRTINDVIISIQKINADSRMMCNEIMQTNLHEILTISETEMVWEHLNKALRIIRSKQR